jgi:hypothetical protein
MSTTIIKLESTYYRGLLQYTPLPNSIKAHVQAHIQNPVYPRIGMWIKGIPTYRHLILFNSIPYVRPSPIHLTYVSAPIIVAPANRTVTAIVGPRDRRRTVLPLTPDSPAPISGQAGQLAGQSCSLARLLPIAGHILDTSPELFAPINLCMLAHWRWCVATCQVYVQLLVTNARGSKTIRQVVWRLVRPDQK